jgi:hypothetical protein
MDRNWHGSNPPSNRYRGAIDRERPRKINPRQLFCTRALLVHVFVVRVLYDGNLNGRVNSNED